MIRPYWDLPSSRDCTAFFFLDCLGIVYMEGVVGTLDQPTDTCTAQPLLDDPVNHLVKARGRGDLVLPSSSLTLPKAKS